jgi:hypothetical protein
MNRMSSVPNVYPVDLFEHLWMVDRLERLGVSHYFKQEIKDALEYVYRYNSCPRVSSLFKSEFRYPQRDFSEAYSCLIIII